MQQAAPLVTGSNRDDGFAKAIQRYILGNNRSDEWVRMARAGVRA